MADLNKNSRLQCQISPRQFEQWNALDRAKNLQREGRWQEALTHARSVLALNPQHSEALSLVGALGMKAGLFKEAAQAFQTLTALNPCDPKIRFLHGNVLVSAGQLEEAETAFRDALRIDPEFPGASNNLGVVLKRLGRSSEAEALYREKLRRNPAEPDTVNNLVNLLRTHGRLTEATQVLNVAIAQAPDTAVFHNLLGGVFLAEGLAEAAERAYLRSLELAPEHTETYNQLVILYSQSGRLREAETVCRKALRIQPDYVECLNNLGVILKQSHRLTEALTIFDHVLKLRPEFADAHNNYGNVLKALGRNADAAQAFRTALELQPDRADAHYNLAGLLFDQKLWAEASRNFDRVLELNPNYPYALGMALLCRALQCDWENFEHLQLAISNSARAGLKTAAPFSFLGFVDDPEAQRLGAEIFVRDKIPTHPNPFQSLRFPRGERIRIAYVSPDFHNHPVAHLISDLIEGHDRQRFEIIGVSIGGTIRDAWRERLERAFDRFIDGTGIADETLAEHLRGLHVDIAVDLTGHTRNARPDLFSHRIAPVQVNYLGFPGTSGANFIDYLIADDFIVPPGQDRFYTEKVVRLPDTFQIAARRHPAAWYPTRAELGLPDTGFVFCCFNNAYKIQAPVFDTWLRLLKRVPDSVLWLYANNPSIEHNLRTRAKSQGIDPTRLVFGDRLSPDRYLARYRAADLFLDTPTYNAGTTASDALWMGLPVITVPGQAYAARMGGSLLRAAGLEDLIAPDLTAYEELAYRLATDPAALAATKTRLCNNHATAPLFNVPRSIRHIETAYSHMLEVWHQNGKAASFSVTPIDTIADTEAYFPATIKGSQVMKKVLHVGCGPARRDKLPKCFHSAEWTEVRLDIDANVAPDIVASMTDMAPMTNGSVAALYSSHNLEHLYPHQVPEALGEFHRVLCPEGFAFITLPDLQAVAQRVAEDRLDEPVYQSPAGPITPLDILYGHRPSMARGNLFMAHRTGFTAKTLAQALSKAGFASVQVYKDGKLNLWAIAVKTAASPARMEELKQALLGKMPAA